MSRMLTSYAIGRPTRSCAATGTPLNVGDHYVAALLDTGEALPTRADYSVAAWSASRPPARQIVAFWRSTVPDPERRTKPILDDDALLDLFESTATGAQGEVEPDAPTDGASGREGSGARGASRAAVRFVLAILLIRRRLLAQESVGAGGVLRLRRRGDPRPPEGPPLIEVADPGLDEATLSDVLGYLEDLGAVVPAADGASGAAKEPA